MKRLFDFTFAILGLTILFPILIILSLLIIITSSGVVLYSQKRVGKQGRLFTLYKFRTMVHNADTMSGGSITVENDDRITAIGKLLRRWKLDELPTLWNVLKGDMSFVGPRPTVKMDVEKMDEKQRYRHSVLPGLTGLAQINGNTSLNWPERIKYDLEYVRKRSCIFDLKIIFRTIMLIIKSDIQTHPKGKNEWEDN